MKTHILRALTEKSFSYLWLGEVFTQISINVLNFFLVLLVYEMTKSNTAVSGIIITFTAPAIIFGLLAGAYVDRWNKKKVLIITNLTRAVLLIILALNVENIFLLYVLSLLIAVITQFFIPAETPMIPLVVKKEHLLSANALFGLAFSGSIVIAYLLAAPLLTWLGPISTFVGLAAMLVVATGLISLIKITHDTESREKVDKTLNVFQEIKNSFSLLTQRPAISHALFFLALSQILTLIIAAIAPGYASQVLGINLENFSLYFAAPAAIGMAAGGVILVNFFHGQRKKHIITIGILLSAICLMLLPFGSKVVSRDFVPVLNAYLPALLTIDIVNIMIVLIFFIGIANAFVFVPANTIIQEQTTDEFRGRIYGFLNSIVGIFSLVPLLLVGGLSDLVGVGSVLVGIGFSLLLLGMYTVLLKP